MLRELIAKEFRDYVPELDSPNLPVEDMLASLETEAEAIER